MNLRQIPVFSKSIRNGFSFFTIFLCMVISLAARGEINDTTYSVELKLNLSRAVEEHIFRPDSDQVFVVVAPGFPLMRLVPGPGNVYSYVISSGLDSAAVYEYKFRINDTTWETVTRSFTAKPGYQSITSWWNDDPLNRTTFRVNMAYAKYYGLFDPAADSVTVTGTMNEWQGSPALTREDTTLVYNISYVLDPGSVHHYKFRINSDSSGLELLWKPDRLVRVPDTLLSTYADFNNFNPAKRLITFRCNMEYYIRSFQFDSQSDFVDIAGNFNENGVRDALFDTDGDSVYTLDKYLDTTWFSHGPLSFRFRINGSWNSAELAGKPDRTYAFHDTVNQNPNIFSCYYNDLDPAVPTPPWATNVIIQGNLVYKKNLSGSYGYQNVNGIPEGISAFRWLRSDNAQGTGAVPIDSAWKITYVVDTLDIGKWLVFEVTPKAASGDSATGKPVQVVSSNSISAWDVGIGDLTTMSIRIFPNPASDWISVVVANEIDRLEVVNYLNQTVRVIQNVDSNVTGLHVGGLPRGLYLIKAGTNTGLTGVARFVKL